MLDYFEPEYVLDVLQDNLHFPEIANAYEQMNKFDRHSFEVAIEIALGKIETQLVKDIQEEYYDSIFFDAFEKGRKKGMQIAVETMREELNDFEFNMGIKEEDDENN